jgi:hypothetical protein
LESSSDFLTFLGSGLLLGLALPEVMEGDLICPFLETDIMALLHQNLDDSNYQVVG